MMRVNESILLIYSSKVGSRVFLRTAWLLLITIVTLSRRDVRYRGSGENIRVMLVDCSEIVEELRYYVNPMYSDRAVMMRNNLVDEMI